MGRKGIKNCCKNRAKRKKRSSSTKILDEMANKELNVSLSDSISSNEMPTFLQIDSDSPIDENFSEKENLSLQEAFLKFRKDRQKEILELKIAQDTATGTKLDENRMADLRMKFLDRCQSYIGVPYKKKHHKPGTPEYNSKLFLDCCGLVRRALRDLRKDFRFTIGPWNQAYMFDTLPIEVKREEDMQPGDLVFISGIYFNKMRPQPHHMVHVEVWLGDGQKTVGARWHKGRIQVFDSYQFVSTSYHSMTYHFRSIDTWLQGTCKSFCPKHKWKRPRRTSPSKKSIFFETQSLVTTQSQIIEQQNVEDIANIDASQDESEKTAAPSGLINNLKIDDQRYPCQEETDDDLSCQQFFCNTNGDLKDETDLTTNEVRCVRAASETTVKYVSLSKKVELSLPTNHNVLLIKEPESGQPIRKPKSASASPSSPRNRSQSPRPKSTEKVAFFFTNKSIPRDTLTPKAIQIVQPIKLITSTSSSSLNKPKNSGRHSPKSNLKRLSKDKKMSMVADSLLNEVVDCALAKLKDETKTSEVALSQEEGSTKS